MINGRWVEGEKGDVWRTCRCGLISPFFGTPFEYNDNWEDGYIYHENQRKYQQITLNQLKQNIVCGNM